MKMIEYKILQVKEKDFNTFVELKKIMNFKENYIFFRELLNFYIYNNEEIIENVKQRNNN